MKSRAQTLYIFDLQVHSSQGPGGSLGGVALCDSGDVSTLPDVSTGQAGPGKTEEIRGNRGHLGGGSEQTDTDGLTTQAATDLQSTFRVRQELVYCRRAGESWRQRGSHFWLTQKTAPDEGEPSRSCGGKKENTEVSDRSLKENSGGLEVPLREDLEGSIISAQPDHVPLFV